MKKHLLFLTMLVAVLCLLLPATAIATEGESVYEAQIGEEMYESLSDAFAQGGEITLLKDVTITTTLTVSNEVVLNLNGKTLTGAPAEAKVYSVIQNKGTLTINDSVGTGQILCDHRQAGSTSYAVNTINNSGTLIINGGTIENKSTASYQIGYAIDNNSTSNNATLIMNGGTINVSGSYHYDGIRLFCNSLTVENSVTVNGGSVSSIWLQNPSDDKTNNILNTKEVKGSVTISGGTVNALYLEPSTGFKASVTGGYIGKIAYNEDSEGRDLTHFITGGSFPVNPTAFLAENKIAVLKNGLYYAADKPEKVPNVSVGITSQDTTTNDVEIKIDGMDMQTKNELTNAIIGAVNNTETQQDLQNAANNLQHDTAVVGTKEEATKALEQDGVTDFANKTVEVQVKPFLNVTVEKYDAEEGTVKLDIKAMYDVYAVLKNSEGGIDKETKLSNEAQQITNVPAAITITIPLPEGFVEPGTKTVYVYHTKANGTLYIHEATVSADGKTATFVNDQGFSSFEVKTQKTELKTFYSTSLTLGNNLDINFCIEQSKLPANKETLVAKFTRSYADDRAVTYTEIPFADWVVDGSYYSFAYTGIAAKEMCDDVTVQIFDGNTPISIAFTESIQKYAQRLFGWDEAELRDIKMLIGVLDYGTLAQEYLNYNTMNPANSVVTPADKNKAAQA